MVLFLIVGQLFPISFPNAVGPKPLDDALMRFDEVHEIRLKSGGAVDLFVKLAKRKYSRWLCS